MIALAREADRTWMNNAAFRGHDPDMWYPARLPTNDTLTVCARCPVREQCADYADTHHERHGIWGGMTSEQRYRRARMRKIGVQ